NANYIRHRIEEYYPVPFPGTTKHEFVSTADLLKEKGGSAKSVAKLLAERGIHPPTNYFPLIVSEALMIEPTETETLKELDRFADAMIDIAKNATVDDFELSPRTTSVARVDEVLAAKELRLNWRQI
ncbi:MAG: aminomethyl-transferring glycine dehydrogenase subunit GcvPB, partial [Thermoplasmata archaeon]|nr:aminomethyl-transferring glycine dehydrogenase subunit GcvPB [Thermoplasmata archaeon]